MVSQLALPEGGEWIILLAVVVVLFGANKLPDLTRNAARALVEYRKITSGEDTEVEATRPAPRPKAQSGETIQRTVVRRASARWAAASDSRPGSRARMMRRSSCGPAADGEIRTPGGAAEASDAETVVSPAPAATR